VTEARRSAVPIVIIQLFEDNRDRALSIERIAEHLDYSVKNTGSLISQLRKNRSNLRIEVPSHGVYIYRGTSTVDDVLAAEAKPLGARSHSADALKPLKPARVMSGGSLLSVGDLVEVIGFSQDGTPLVRDTGGKLYLLNQL